MATSTITVVDQYCDAYRDLFTEVRTFENFKHLHVGMLSDIKRKSLPEIAKAVGLHDSQQITCSQAKFITYWRITTDRDNLHLGFQKLIEIMNQCIFLSPET